MSEDPSSSPPLPPPAELPTQEAKDSGVLSLLELDARSLSDLLNKATPDEVNNLFLSLDPKDRHRLERLCDETLAALPKEQAIVSTPEANRGVSALNAEAEQLSTAVVAVPEAAVLSMPPPEAVVGVDAPTLPRQWEVNSLAIARTPVQLAQAKKPSFCEKLRRFDAKESLKALALGAPPAYCESLARRHWAWLLAYSCVIVAVLSAGWNTIVIDTDIQAFRRLDDSKAFLFHAAWRDALRQPKGVVNATSLEDRKTFQIELYYQAKAGSVFAEAPLRDIRALEEKLRGLSGWVKMCQMSDPASRFRCQPGESMANYAWPERAEIVDKVPTPFNLEFNGVSRERLPVDAVLTYLGEGRAGSHDLRKFLPHNGGAQADLTQADSTLLRTVFSFTAPSHDSAAFEKEYEKFIAEELFLVLKKEIEAAEEIPDDPYIDPWSIRLYYKSKEIQDHEVRFYLNKDITLTIGCLVFIFIFLVFQLRSVVLAFAGLAQVCLVPLIAYVAVNLEKLSLTSFACIFLVMGLVSNDLPAAKEYWRRVGKESNHRLPVSSYGSMAYSDELIQYYSYRVSLLFPALFLRLLPQFMVSLSFLVFLASKLKPIVEFGQVMCASMLISCGITLTIIPALLVLHEAWFLPLIYNKLPAGLAMVLEPKDLPFPWRPLTRLLLKVSQPRIGRWIWLGTSIVMLALAIITIVVANNSDNPGLPEVFAESHHSFVGEQLVDAFLPTGPAAEPAPSGTRVCEMKEGNTAACGLHWCEAPLSPEEDDGGRSTTIVEPEPQAASACHCQVNRDLSTISGCQYLNIGGKMSGHAFASATHHERSFVWKNYIRSVLPSLDHSFMDGWQPGGKKSSSLVLEHWATGKTDVEPVIEMPWKIASTDTTINPNQTSSNTCNVETSCYCGPRVCARPANWLDGQSIAVPVPVASSRRLFFEPQIPTPSMREIIRAWGISENKEEDGTVKAKISSFGPQSPWAQRSMLSICTDIPESFNVLEKTCWIEDFKTFLVSEGEKFPTQRFGDFHTQFKRFRNERPDVKITAMWTNGQGDLIATAFSFMVPPKPRSDVTGILDEMKAWQDYAGWVTSDGWFEAEAESEAMSSSWSLLMLAYIAVILAGLIYTWDVAFTFITVGIATLALVFVSFFMFCLFGWAIGPWEVILMVVFLHHFTEPAFRVGRGAVWAGVMVTEMRIAGNAVTLHAERTNPKQQLDLAPPDLPSAIEDVESPSPARDIEPPETPAPLLDTATPITDAQPNTDEETPAALNEPGAAMYQVGPLESENTSENDEPVEDAARSAFEGRLHRFTLNIANTVFPLALKLMFCAFFLLFCTFRLFSRLGVVTLLVEIVIIPCIFILLPAAILLCPTREEPDIILLYKFINRKLAERSDSVDNL